MSKLNLIKLHEQWTFAKFCKTSNQNCCGAQGTIEYLVLLAVVLIVALLAVFLINGLGNGEAINVTGEKLLSTSSGVSVVDAVVDEDGNGLISLSNKSGQGITIKSIGGSEYTYFLPTGESVVFSATELDDLGCKCNGSEVKKVCSVPVTYEDSKGIPKTESIKIEMSCVESEYIDFSNAVSPGTTAISGGGSSSGGNSSTSGGVTPLNVSVPSVVLLSPASGFDVNEDVVSKKVDFNFSVNSDVNLTSCNLLVNNVDVNSLTNLTVGNYILSYTFSNDGNYSWKVNCTNSGGTSTVSNLYLTMDNNYQEIIDCQGLQDMNKHLDGNYRLMKNVDCASQLNFTPIGNNPPGIINPLTVFRGNFDGQNYNIYNLNINQSDQNYVGLFGIGYRSKIKNVGLIDANIIGNYVVGGLIGYNYFYSYVSNSFLTGKVIGYNTVGGLIGANYFHSSVSNSFFTGQVTGNNYIGGLIGENSDSSPVSNSFFTGQVIGNSSVGGLIGYNAVSSISNSYYDTNTSTQTDTGKGIPKTTLELTTIPIPSGVYTDWDFETIWSHDINGNYPILKWQIE
ncbi:MAG: GLUG motif-containing protein [Candidatus ainarchaeum sp.]|nr:GLUG motif-containing protein [Candidatus ainarchaeum sp.]